MNTYIVSYHTKNSHWITCGKFRARSAAGALQQFAKDLRNFPDCVAIRAILATGES